MMARARLLLLLALPLLLAGCYADQKKQVALRILGHQDRRWPAAEIHSGLHGH